MYCGSLKDKWFAYLLLMIERIPGGEDESQSDGKEGEHCDDDDD